MRVRVRNSEIEKGTSRTFSHQLQVVAPACKVAPGLKNGIRSVPNVLGSTWVLFLKFPTAGFPQKFEYTNTPNKAEREIRIFEKGETKI